MSDEVFWNAANRDRYRAFGMANGLCDQAAALEIAAQDLFFPALARFQGAVRRAAALSGLKRQDFHYLLDALDDYTPNRARWNEQLAQERLTGERP